MLMRNSINDRLFNACKKQGLTFQHVAEIGMYYPETANTLDFIAQGCRATIVEADPLIATKIKEYFASQPGIELHQVAVWDKNEPVTLYRSNASTFIGKLENTPALVNDAYQFQEQDRFETSGVTFNTLDDGTIDLLVIDIEGADWFVLKYLVSRPLVISLEIQAGNYINPFMNEIKGWFETNGYQRWFLNDTDAVYYKKGAFVLSQANRLYFGWHSWLTAFDQNFQRFRKKIKKILFLS